MSTTARPERDENALRPSGAAVTQELPLVSAELRAALNLDQAQVRREVIIWQSWVRHLALGTMVVLSFLFGSIVQRALLPLGLLTAVYIAIVAGTASLLRGDRTRSAHGPIASLLVASDIGAAAGFVAFTAPPAQLHRILLLGFLSMQLGVFYFGHRQGWLAASLTAIAYLTFALVLPPFVAGPRADLATVGFNVTLFTLVALVSIRTLGSFRARIDALRMYCKVAERGEGAMVPRLGVERWPDDLTLLARSLQSMHARLGEQLGSDPLTGCMNRRAFETTLRSDLRQARRRGSTVALVAVDVDHFKQINDSRGHPVGDLVLQQIAGIMLATARDSDTVARSGGDEFLIILPDTGWQGALTFAERLRQQVDEFTFGPPGASMSISISVGVALSREIDPTSSEWLLREADIALYKAKAAGRNRVFS